MGIGSRIPRVDAFEKVTGRARYTDDFQMPGCLYAKIVRSTIANGKVLSIQTDQARQVEGVVEIFTCFQVPDIQFPTPGHPWSVEPAHQDVSDRKLLNQRVRIYGDEIAVVVAKDPLAAKKAASLVEAQYEEYPVALTPAQAMEPGFPAIHEEKPNNILAHSHFQQGGVPFEEAAAQPGLSLVSGTYQTQTVQHCHIEPVISSAYMEGSRIVVVSSTQIPHIVRRVVGQALGVPWGRIRVIKPYIGGGFGNKQEVLYEPLAAWLTLQLGGRPVKVELTREEIFSCTRVRHAIEFQLRTAVRADGRLMARKFTAWSNQGGYASHGHAIVANAANGYRHLYQDEQALEEDAYTVYTNISSGGAMRGYGIPQLCFAMESHMDDVAAAIGMDPVEFRLKNCMRQGYVDPGTGITCYSSGLRECLEKGMEAIGWKEKRLAAKDQNGSLRRGVGMAMFSYKTGVYPISLETASARMILNQDGSAQLQLGATEIGQGADTVFTQMAAETTGIEESQIHIVSFQDTDVAPFDTGAYASRQTYVTGMAVKDTAMQFKKKLLEYAGWLLKRPQEELDLRHGKIVEKTDGSPLLTLEELAMNAFYNLERSVHITAEATHHCKDNTFAFGACFVEVEVDIPVGKVKVLKILNVHDSGVLINPQLAEAQVHGGMSMGLGYALGECLRYDAKGRPLNGNLLDYKLPTAMDTPELEAEFVETVDPSGPYGNKALGEPPAIPVAPAVRNAILNATSVALNRLPFDPQSLVETFTEAGLIERREAEVHV